MLIEQSNFSNIQALSRNRIWFHCACILSGFFGILWMFSMAHLCSFSNLGDWLLRCMLHVSTNTVCDAHIISRQSVIFEHFQVVSMFFQTNPDWGRPGFCIFNDSFSHSGIALIFGCHLLLYISKGPVAVAKMLASLLKLSREAGLRRPTSEGFELFTYIWI